MSLAQMRKAIFDAYPGGDWARRVNRMPDHQVAAVYNRMLAKGQLNKEKK